MSDDVYGRDVSSNNTQATPKKFIKWMLSAASATMNIEIYIYVCVCVGVCVFVCVCVYI